MQWKRILLKHSYENKVKQPAFAIREKLQALQPNKNHQRSKGKLPSRNSSAADNCKQQIKYNIKQLEDQTRKLKLKRKSKVK